MVGVRFGGGCNDSVTCSAWQSSNRHPGPHHHRHYQFNSSSLSVPIPLIVSIITIVIIIITTAAGRLSAVGQAARSGVTPTRRRAVACIATAAAATATAAAAATATIADAANSAAADLCGPPSVPATRRPASAPGRLPRATRRLPALRAAARPPKPEPDSRTVAAAAEAARAAGAAGAVEVAEAVQAAEAAARATTTAMRCGQCCPRLDTNRPLWRRRRPRTSRPVRHFGNRPDRRLDVRWRHGGSCDGRLTVTIGPCA